jgi:catechol 2,3-dioxygenase-like lactoylglutathione lyase family enzyme
MKRSHPSRIPAAVALAIAILLCLMTLGSASGRSAQPPSPGPGKVLGFSFDALQVADLEKSIRFYRSLGFELSGSANPPWNGDEALNRLYQAKHARFRFATLTIANAITGQPFTLRLCEAKGVVRRDRSDVRPWDARSSHFGMTVPDADALWTRLQSAGLLRPLTWEGKLIRIPGQSTGGLAYIMDPDGMKVEIIGQRPAQPATATQAAAPAGQLGVNHVGLVAADSVKSKAFYGGLLGAQFPDTPSQWLSGDFYDSVVGGHGNILRLINGNFSDPSATDLRMRIELVEYQNVAKKDSGEFRFSDIGINCLGMAATALDSLYARIKSAGVETWSEGGIVKMKDGARAVVVRDPDVGNFVELFERPAK